MFGLPKFKAGDLVMIDYIHFRTWIPEEQPDGHFSGPAGVVVEDLGKQGGPDHLYLVDFGPNPADWTATGTGEFAESVLLPASENAIARRASS